MAAAGFRIAAAALLCASCTSIQADKRTFEGTGWRIRSINGVPTPSSSWVYWVRFSGGYMRGNICNRFEAPYEVVRNVLQLHGFMSTERGCSNPDAQVEKTAFAILHRPMRMNWASSRRLTLSNAAGSIALDLLR